jgi:phosphate-selective porin OprO/OprP
MERNSPSQTALALMAAAVLSGTAAPGRAQDDADRVKALEDAVESLKKEVESLREQTADRNEKAAAQSKADSQTPTVSWREGVSISDPRGEWSLRFFGRVQLDYRQFDPDAAANTFGIRRARLGANMNFLKDYGLTVEGEYATGSASGTTTQGASITNAFMDFNWFSKARIRAGQFKPQFGLENTASANFSDFQERALTQNLIQNLNYDRGIMVHGAPAKGVNYGVTISNGTGLNLEERQLSPQDVDADGKMLTARLTADVAQMLVMRDKVIHLGGSYKSGKAANSQANPYTAATGQTEGRGVVFFNPEAFASATVAGSNVDRTLSVAELAIAHKSWKILGEYWQAQYEGERATAPVTPYDRKIDSGYLDVMWLITGESYSDTYANGIFQRIRPRSNFSREADGGWGAIEVGLRYSFFDAGDFLDATAGQSNTGRLSTAGTGVTASTPTKEADAWTLGLKWMPNAYSRLMLNYIITRFDSPIVANGIAMDEEKSLTFRAQMDF